MTWAETRFPWWTRQRQSGLTDAQIRSQYDLPGAPDVPRPPARPGSYRAVLQAIEDIIKQAQNPEAKAWLQSMFNVYRDYTKAGGRTTEMENVFQYQLQDLLDNVPETAQPYAAAIQKVVEPSVRNPAREWYEMPAPRRTSPINWRARGFVSNPQWW